MKKIKNRIAAEIGYPCIIKPNDQGSTCGLSVCFTPDDIHGAVELCLTMSNDIIIEKFIPGRELTIGILDDIVFPRWKYVPNMIYTITNANILPE